jgi:ribose 5-phosphate isomerase B
MKIAVCSDELFPIHDFCVEELIRLGHSVMSFGAIKSRKDECYASVAREAALAIVRKECDEGVFFCYTGTGISIAANKLLGIRAALCVDAKTASEARMWNEANVLALSNRLITADVLKEILIAWLAAPKNANAMASIETLKKVDAEYRKKLIYRFIS